LARSNNAARWIDQRSVEIEKKKFISRSFHGVPLSAQNRASCKAAKVQKGLNAVVRCKLNE
jgi:hypothetical protein